MKYNPPVGTLSLGKSLENFLTYLEPENPKTARPVKSDNNNIYSFLIEHNSQVFDTPTLLRQGGHQLCEKVYFLSLMKNLVTRKHPSLVL